MWFNEVGAEVAVECPHCKERDWRTADELKDGRLFCFFCGRFSAWLSDSGRADPDQAQD